jgi:nucleoside-diphosphate-sugar epimerase
MKALITRATGFIGSGLVRELLKDGKEVKVPAGVKSGNVLKLRGACQATDGHPGDILIKIKIK